MRIFVPVYLWQHWQQIDVELLEIISKLYIVFWKVEITIKCAKIRYGYRLFSLLNFPWAAILDFVTSYGWLYCQGNSCVNSKMAPEKSENRRKSRAVLFDTEILFPCFPTKFDFEVRQHSERFRWIIVQYTRFYLPGLVGKILVSMAI